MRRTFAALALSSLALPAFAEPHDNIAGTLLELAEARQVEIALPPARPASSDGARTRAVDLPATAAALPRRPAVVRDLWLSYGTGF